VLQAAGVGVPALFAGLGLLSLAAAVAVARAWGREGASVDGVSAAADPEAH
jgi:hypothetical protein